MKLFREELNEDVLLVDLDRIHRIRKKRGSNSKPRPVIVSLRSTIFVKKFLKLKKPKGKNISITENLTGYRMSVLNQAREKFGFKMYGHTTDGFYIKITVRGKR